MTSQASWNRFGSIIDLIMSRTVEGQSPAYLRRMDPTPSHILAQPSALSPRCPLRTLAAWPYLFRVCTQGGLGTGHGHNLSHKAQVSP